MKKGKRIIVVVTVLIVIAVVSLWAQDRLPGINADDQHPRGCVDCHAASDSRDSRLNVSLRKVDGHPVIDTIVNTVPDDCMKCHGGYASKLSTITHASHYANPEDNRFIAYYAGQCLECHSLNTATGEMTVKSAPKNW